MWSDLPFEGSHPCLVCKSGRILHTERWICELVDVDCRFPTLTVSLCQSSRSSRRMYGDLLQPSLRSDGQLGKLLLSSNELICPDNCLPLSLLKSHEMDINIMGKFPRVVVLGTALAEYM